MEMKCCLGREGSGKNEKSEVEEDEMLEQRGRGRDGEKKRMKERGAVEENRKRKKKEARK